MHISDRIMRGDATSEDIDLLHNVSKQIQGKCLCALGEFSTMSVISAIDEFRSDFAAKVRS